MKVDNLPLVGSTERPDVPGYLTEAYGCRRPVELLLPEGVLADLLRAQEELGIAASDLAAYWIKTGARAAAAHRRAALNRLSWRADRIVGWMPDGTPETD